MTREPNPLPYVRDRLDEQQSLGPLFRQTEIAATLAYAVQGAPRESTLILDEAGNDPRPRREHRKASVALIMDTQRTVGIGKVDMALQAADRYREVDP